MAKEYPIQNVSFRGETDNFLTEAGGDSRVPKWVNDATISANGERVYGQLESSQNYSLMQIERCLCLQRLH